MTTTIHTFRAMKEEGKKIVFLTAYDWLLAHYYHEHEAVPSERAVRDVVRTLAAHALLNSSVHPRIARASRTSRNSLSLPFPYPNPDPPATLQSSRSLLSVAFEDDWRRCLAWLLAALRPNALRALHRNRLPPPRYRRRTRTAALHSPASRHPRRARPSALQTARRLRRCERIRGHSGRTRRFLPFGSHAGVSPNSFLASAPRRLCGS